MKLSNKIIHTILILSFVVVTGQNTIAYLYFKINQNYIAKTLCVQKDNPENFCMGNCYLAAIEKRLNKSKEQKNNNAIPVKYNSSNPVQEYIINQKFIFNKIENVILFSSNKTYQILIKDYAPSTPPPKFV